MSTYTQHCFSRWLNDKNIGTVFEIGSRDGLDSLALIETYNPEIVYCMECNPEAIDIIKTNISNSPRIRLIERAAWSENKDLDFFRVIKSKLGGREEKNIGASSAFQDAGWYGEEYIQERITVTAARVDTLCQENGVDGIDLVCMDVQGAELHVLQGFGAILQKTRFIISELEFRPIYKDQSLVTDVMKFLFDRGFELLACSVKFDEFGDFLFGARGESGNRDIGPNTFDRRPTAG